MTARRFVSKLVLRNELFLRNVSPSIYIQQKNLDDNYRRWFVRHNFLDFLVFSFCHFASQSSV